METGVTGNITINATAVGSSVTVAGSGINAQNSSSGNTGTVSVNSATVNLAADIRAAAITGTATTVNVQSNAAQIQDGIDVAVAGATVNVAAGNYGEAINVNKALTVQLAAAAGVTINSLAGVAGGSLDLNGGTLTTGDGTDSTFAGVISGGNGSLVKQGSGTFTLSGDSIYTGGTTVRGMGQLVVTGSLTSDVTVNTLSALLGTGTVGSVTVTSMGFVQPGTAAGSLATLSTNDLVINGGVYLAGTGATTSDTLAVTGTVTLSGSPSLSVNSTATPTAQTFTLIDNDGTDAIVGTFDNAADGDAFTLGGQTYFLSYFGGDGNDLTLTAAGGGTPATVTGTAADDTFTVRRTGNTVQVLLNGNVVATRAVSDTSGFTLNGAAGDDTFNIDYSGGFFAVPLTVNGQTNASATAGDTLNVLGSSVTFATVTAVFTNANDGSLDLNGTLITYTGLEPITFTPTAGNLILEFQNAGAETITLSDDATTAGSSFVDSTLGESLSFVNPTNSLTIRTNANGGGGADTVNIQGVDAAFDADLTIDAADDTVTFQTLPTDIGSGNYDITANTLTVTAAVTTTGTFNATVPTVNLNADITAGTITGTATTVNVQSDAASIQDAIDVAAAGATTTVTVAAGTYAEFVRIDKTLMLLGAQSGMDADVRAVAFIGGKANDTIETVITSPVSDPAGNSDLVRTLADGITFDGFVVDGNNANLAGASTAQFGGLDIDARDGITNFDFDTNGSVAVNNLTVANNIVQNVGGFAVYQDGSSSAAASTGNLISANVLRTFAADTATNFGGGVILFNNAYVDITDNTIVDNVGGQIGVSVQTFFLDGTMRIGDNRVTVGQDGFGIHINNVFAPAAVFTIDANRVDAAAGVTADANVADPTTTTWGINAWSIQVGSTVTETNNIIGSLAGGGTFDRGYNVWNGPTTNPVSISGGTVANSLIGLNLDSIDPFFGAGADTVVNVANVAITGGAVGVRVRNAPLGTPPSQPGNNGNVPTGSVRLNVTGGSISGASTGILVQDGMPGDGFNAALQLAGGTTITNGTTGLRVAGADADLVGNTLSMTTFTGQSGNFITLANGAEAGNEIDGTGASFGAFDTTGANLANEFAVEDKIFHLLDAPGLGFVRVTANNVYVTQNSGSIQRGVNAATAGDTVNVAAVTFTEDVTVAKQLTLEGAQQGTPAAGRVGAESNVTGSFTVSAAGVTIDGFSLTAVTTGVGVGVTGTGGAGNLTVVNNAIANYATGVVLNNGGTVTGNAFTGNIVDLGINATAAADAITVSATAVAFAGNAARNVTIDANVNRLRINGGDGNDTLTVDYTGGVSPPNVIFNGGNQTGTPGDTLIVTGGGFNTAVFNYTNANDGNIVFDGGAASVLYTGLEPILVNAGTATNFVFNLPGTADDATLQVAANGTDLVLTSNNGTFESTTFDPTGVDTITINGNGGNDTLTLPDLTGVFLGSNVTLNGNAGNDTFNVTPSQDSTTMVNGGAPARFPGDVLNIIAPPNHTSTVTFTGPGSGVVTTTGPGNYQNITFTSIEQVPGPGSVGVNRAPVANNDTYFVNEDSPLIVTAPGLLANDSDPDGDALTVTAVTQPTNGVLVSNGDGGFTYTPDTDYFGPDSFTYTISDGKGGMATATVNITVRPINDAPVATPDGYTLAEEGTLTTTAATGVLANDTDVDGPALTAQLINGPARGTLTFNADGSFSYTPTANYNGPDSFTYRATDGTAFSAVTTVSLTVTAVNDAPVAQNRNVVTSEDRAVSGNVRATDSDGDPLTYTLVTDPATAAGTLAFNPDGSFTFTPAANFNGTASFTYTASDGTATSNTATVNITVTAVNDAPTTSDVVATTNEDAATTVAVVAADVDGNPLTYTVISGPSNGTVVNNGGGSFGYTPRLNFNGTDSFRVRISDGNGGVVFSNVSITVTPVNDAPTAQNRSVATNEDTLLTGQLTASDVDGDPLTFELVSGPSNGTLTLNGNGSFSYTPNANFNGPDSFDYSVSDGTATITRSVTITVNPVNDAPTTQDVAATTSEDAASPLLLTVPATDLDGDALSYTVVAGVTHGTVVNMGGGSFSYTPDADYNGTDSFRVRVSDGNGGVAFSNVTINVTPVNDAPTAADRTVTTAEDTAITGQLTGSDVDGDPLTYTLVSGPSSDTVTLNPNGSFTYTPAANFSGTATFTYTVNDGTVNSAPATVTVNVTAVNDAPVASPQSVAATEDTSQTISLAASDIEGDPLTYTILSGPVHGTLVQIGATNQFTYTPDANYNGTDSFTFRANDGSLDSNIAAVSITVAAVNDAPTAQNRSVATNEDTLLSGQLTASDVDGDPLTFELVSGPSNGTLTLNGNGSFSYTPNANFNGPDSFDYSVSDGTATITRSVTITVNPVNDAPTTTNVAVEALEDTAQAVTVVASDADGDPLTYTVTTGPAHGRVVNDGNGGFTYTPDANYNGSDSFVVTVQDAAGATAVSTVSVQVVPVNDVPVAVSRSLNVREDRTASARVSAFDADGTTLVYRLVSGPSNGRIAFNTDGTFTYTPNRNYNGSDSFTYRATDGTASSNVATVTINVTPVNDAPVARSRSLATREDTAASGAVTAVDAEGDALTYVLVQGPAKGTLLFNADGTFTYTPNSDENGPDSFTYRANDGALSSNVATVTVTVAAVNDAPVAFDQSVSTGQNGAVSGRLGASDIEGDSLTYAIVTVPSNGRITAFNRATGAYTYTPNAGFSGSDSFTFRANDGTASSNVGTVAISVTPADLQVFVSSVRATEGDQGVGRVLSFIVRLDRPADGTVTVRYNTVDGTAKAGSDYDAAGGMVTFNAGERVKTVEVLVRGDQVTERNESLTLQLSDLRSTGTRGIAAGGLTGFGQILDDDPAKIFVSNAATTEANPGDERFLVFNVRLDHAVDRPVLLRYTTEGLTATAGLDFGPQSGVLRFEPGQRSKSVRIAVRGDFLVEGNELLNLRITDLATSGRNVTLNNEAGVGLIRDDDRAQVFVGNASSVEGNAGDRNEVVFNLRLDQPVDRPVTVSFSTTPDTADRSDYLRTAGTVTFAAGQRFATVTVRLRGDNVVERDELFKLVLSDIRAGSRAVSFGRTEAFGQIVNDDGSSAARVDGLFAAGMADTLI